MLAQDPDVLHSDGGALTTSVSVPAERLERGPKGHRVHVIDYDASANLFYRARDNEVESDPYAKVSDVEKLIRDPHFHQQNVYAIAMATLCEFEGALGRPVGWGFSEASHQLKISPHAFADANAYYSRESESLNFGYFPREDGQTVFTCLSHDIVVHETSHALLDGLRPYYFKPSSTDQAAFHEGFSDVVALLSVFRSEEIIREALRSLMTKNLRISLDRLTLDGLGSTSLARLAEQMGAALEGVPSSALRESLKIKPDRSHYTSARFEEEHDRGELLVAVIMRAFMMTWLSRLQPHREGQPAGLHAGIVAEEGATAARQLLRICIRALDYLPPVDLTYPDYVSALLTADMQLYPDDDKYHYRKVLKETFAAYGIDPASRDRSDGAWNPPCEDDFSMVGVHFERMQRDPTEVFRFIWENESFASTPADDGRPITLFRPRKLGEARRKSPYHPDPMVTHVVVTLVRRRHAKSDQYLPLVDDSGKVISARVSLYGKKTWPYARALCTEFLAAPREQRKPALEITESGKTILVRVPEGESFSLLIFPDGDPATIGRQHAFGEQRLFKALQRASYNLVANRAKSIAVAAAKC
uniref:Uncharacterized protein n=1 Tax=uncultured bacterium A1Q1_fos_600 TaxID=1256587 RepID=L7VV25_9BACT|nr:hypothetical protein [uncultured bacterium A1Q1_fos_600]